MGFKDLYTALQTGLIDGSDKTMADIMQVKLYQVTKYLTLTNHYSIVSTMIVSKKFMEKLDKKDQEIVREAAKPAVQAQVDEVLKSETGHDRLPEGQGRNADHSVWKTRRPSPTSWTPSTKRPATGSERT